MKTGLEGREMGKEEINNEFLSEGVTSSVCIVELLKHYHILLLRRFISEFLSFCLSKILKVLKYKRNMSSISLLF